jgi:hypothetical protein
MIALNTQLILGLQQQKKNTLDSVSFLKIRSWNMKNLSNGLFG